MNIDPEVIENVRLILSTIFPTVTFPQAVLVYCNLINGEDEKTLNERIASTASVIKNFKENDIDGRN